MSVCGQMAYPALLSYNEYTVIVSTRTSPLSARLAHETLERLARSARRKGVPRSALVQGYVEEGLRMEEHPGIVFVDGPAGRRPALRRGPDVWEVVSTLKANEGSVRATAEVLAIAEPQLRIALGYYADHAQEIDDWIHANEEESARAEAAWRRQSALARE